MENNWFFLWFTDLIPRQLDHSCVLYLSSPTYPTHFQLLPPTLKNQTNIFKYSNLKKEQKKINLKGNSKANKGETKANPPLPLLVFFTDLSLPLHPVMCGKLTFYTLIMIIFHHLQVWLKETVAFLFFVVVFLCVDCPKSKWLTQALKMSHTYRNPLTSLSYQEFFYWNPMFCFTVFYVRHFFPQTSWFTSNLLVTHTFLFLTEAPTVVPWKLRVWQPWLACWWPARSSLPTRCLAKSSRSTLYRRTRTELTNSWPAHLTVKSSAKTLMATQSPKGMCHFEW